jgi:hypothetical protein
MDCKITQNIQVLVQAGEAYNMFKKVKYKPEQDKERKVEKINKTRGLVIDFNV